MSNFFGGIGWMVAAAGVAVLALLWFGIVKWRGKKGRGKK